MGFDYQGNLSETSIKEKAKELAQKLNYDFVEIDYLCESLYCQKIANSKKNYKNSAIALVGDNVLKLVLSHRLYNENLDKQFINDKKEEDENNKLLKKVCDCWKVYEYAFNDENFYSVNLADHKKLPHPAHDPYVEAIIGAIYLDRGFDYANKWINDKLLPLMLNLKENK